jgi:beta-N-acetylhexosaminidase
LVAAPVRVSAAPGRATQVTWLTEALREQGVEVSASGGSRVHLGGYGDGVGDLSAAAATVSMDTPYLLGSARSKVRVATYSSTRASLRALAAVIAGRAPAPGRSPVGVAGLPRSACDV